MLEFLPLEERGVILQGLHNITAPYPAAVSSFKSEDPSISSQLSKPCLSFPCQPNGLMTGAESTAI